MQKKQIKNSVFLAQATVTFDDNDKNHDHYKTIDF